MSGPRVGFVRIVLLAFMVTLALPPLVDAKPRGAAKATVCRQGDVRCRSVVVTAWPGKPVLVARYKDRQTVIELFDAAGRSLGKVAVENFGYRARFDSAEWWTWDRIDDTLGEDDAENLADARKSNPDGLVMIIGGNDPEGCCGADFGLAVYRMNGSLRVKVAYVYE